MKYLAITLLFLGLSAGVLPTQAQPTLPQPAASRLLHVVAHLNAAKTAAEYHPSEIIYLTNQDLNWINDTRTRNVYQGGLLHQQYQDTWVGDVFGDWEATNLTEHTYSGGLISQTTTYEQSDAGWVGLSRISYTIQNGVYSQIVYQVYEHEAWVDQSRITYTLAGDLIVAGLEETWDGTWAPSERFTLVEEEGHVVETYQEFAGGAWVNTERSIYQDLTIAELYAFLTQLINDFSDYEGLYLSFRFPDAIQQEWDGSWVNVSRQTTERFYELFTGRPLRDFITAETWEDGSWLPGDQFVVDYATISDVPQELVGMPAKTTYRLHDGSDWVDFLIERYILRNDIRRIVQATTEADFGGGLQEVSRVRIEWTDTSTGVEQDEVPAQIALHQNHPNPFNPSTQIGFTLTEAQHVRLTVFDLLGREVAVLAHGVRPAGTHDVTWEATHMPSGLYLYRLEAGAQSQTRQMVLLK